MTVGLLSLLPFFLLYLNTINLHTYELELLPNNDTHSSTVKLDKTYFYNYGLVDTQHKRIVQVPIKKKLLWMIFHCGTTMA